MANIQMNRGTKAEIDNTPITDGLISFDTDNNYIYLDNEDSRESYGGVKVIPNPEEEPTEVLRNIQVGEDVYKISGGHEIQDDSGDTLTQRDVMQFEGVYAYDDDTEGDEKTKISIVREFQSKSAIEALTGEEAKGFQYLDDDVYDAFTASDIGFDNSDTSFTGNDVQEVLEEVDTALDDTNDRIDDVVVDLSGYKHVEFRGTTASFSEGKATITHNLGKNNKVIPLPNGGLVPFAILNTTQNSFDIQVVWVKSANVADSQMATNYTGNYGVNYFLVY